MDPAATTTAHDDTGRGEPAQAETAAHADHEHPPFLAHHFDSPQQQFDAGKLGMWLFLITEILFFSGLFLAYAVYRSRHPEVFADAHQYLDKSLGAVNTVVLLFSSLTMAWGVRCAQLGQRRGLVWCLVTTLACASLFLGIKAVEYTHKWEMGLFWAGRFRPHEHVEHGLSPILVGLSAPALLALVVFGVWTLLSYRRRQGQVFRVVGGLTITAAAFFAGVAGGLFIPVLAGTAEAGDHGQADGHAAHGDAAADAHSAQGGPAAYAEPADEGIDIMPDSPATGQAADISDTAAAGAVPGDPISGLAQTDSAEGQEARKAAYAGIFFSIYYIMTGVHAVHIVGGMGVIAWLLRRSVRGDFDARYFGPVDYVGLYWHLVDLVWIYLFPLLYLIH